MSSLRIAVAAAALALAAPEVQANDVVLHGTVTSAAGEKLAGVAVSEKAKGSTITTSVFTDANGEYYFPPMAAQPGRVWAQAVTFAMAEANIDLAAKSQQDFALKPVEKYERQLSGGDLLAGLPDATADDQRMKRIVRNVCTGCHTPSYVLQHRFDEAGWFAILDLMKHVNVYGTYQGPNHQAQGIIDSHQRELAAYLARARGPDSPVTAKPHPRPTGEAARVVFREYDVPGGPNGDQPVLNRGINWSRGTPSALDGGRFVHDAWADLDGVLWFTNNSPSPKISLGRIDPVTGEVRYFKIEGQNGLAAGTHGFTRDPDGILWFNTGPTVIPNHGGLGRLDPKTEKIEVFVPPSTMSGTGGAVTVDWDGKGRIWASAEDGALRFDPKTKEFTEFKSLTYKTANGIGRTYGAAADRDGNGYWAEMNIDIIGRGNDATGKSEEIRLPPIAAQEELVTSVERDFYKGFAPSDFNAPFPWSQGPRRMGTDKNADVLWVGLSWGGSLARIDTHTLAVSYVPTPDDQQPYHVAVDSHHNAWTNAWATDQVLRYDPTAKQWTVFDLPTRGSEVRYVSLLEKDGKMEVVLPSFRTQKVAVMMPRSEAELAELKQAAQKQ